MKWREVIDHAISHAILIFFSIVIGYPVLWMIFNSFKGGAEMYTKPWAPPGQLRWENYVEAWKSSGIGLYFLNSLIVTFCTVVVVFMLASMAAYAFARADFPGKNIVFGLFLISLMVPAQVTGIPAYLVVRGLHLLNTRTGLTLLYAAGGMSFAIFLLRAFFQSIPQDLIDSAIVDGCSQYRAFWNIVLPISKPALATMTIFTAMSAWNDFFLALLLIRDVEVRTIPLGLVVFTGTYVIDWAYLFAALCIATIPILVLYILMQKQFISGLTAGALKA